MRTLLWLTMLLMSLAAEAQMVIVVDHSSTLTELRSEDVENIFMARTKRLPSGDRAVPLELKDAEIRGTFYRSISGKNLRQLNAYWASLVFTGKGKPPKGFDNIEQLEQRLSSQPGTITYLPMAMVSDTMRIVFQFDKTS